MNRRTIAAVLIAALSFLCFTSPVQAMYNTGTGRFHTMDSYEGSDEEPRSLHKYTYAHANPVDNSDPSGLMSVNELNQVVSTQVQLAARTSVNLLKSLAGRNSTTKLLFGDPPKDFGLVGEWVIDLALDAVTGHLGGTFKDMGAFGTAAHKSLEDSLKNSKLKRTPFLGVELEAEVFFLDRDSKSGKVVRAGRRQEGSVGVDILAKYHGKPVIGFDLKIGRHMGQKRANTLLRRTGVGVVEMRVKFSTELD